MEESNKDSGCYNLANDHVQWFLELIRPLLISHFEHGYKHGVEDTKENNQKIHLTKKRK